MARLIPEHTIDSSLAYEILRAYPTAALWSPTPTAGSHDHEVRTRSSSWIFECKAADPASGTATAWRTPHVDQSQLRAYLGGALNGRVIYIFLAQPISPAAPWLRTCSCAPRARGYCDACYVPKPNGHRRERRWSGLDATYMQQVGQPHRLVQAWFNHWAWCISATDLDAYLASQTPRLNSFDLADTTCSAIPGAVRLCHFLKAARQSANGGVPPDGANGNGADEVGSDSTGGGNDSPIVEPAPDNSEEHTTALAAAALCDRTRVSGDQIADVLGGLVEVRGAGGPEPGGEVASPPMVMMI